MPKRMTFQCFGGLLPSAYTNYNLMYSKPSSDFTSPITFIQSYSPDLRLLKEHSKELQNAAFDIKYPSSHQVDKASLNMTNIDEAGKRFCQYQHKFFEHMEKRLSGDNGWLNRIELRIKCDPNNFIEAIEQAFVDLWSMQTRYVVTVLILKYYNIRINIVFTINIYL